MLPDALRLAEKTLQFFPHDVFEVHDGNLVVALPAEVFGCPGIHIHLVSTGAMRKAAKKVRWSLAGLLPSLYSQIGNEFVADTASTLAGSAAGFGVGDMIVEGTELTGAAATAVETGAESVGTAAGASGGMFYNKTSDNMTDSAIGSAEAGYNYAHGQADAKRAEYNQECNSSK